MPRETFLKVWLGRKDCTKFLLAGRWSAQTMWWSFVFSKCTRNLLQTFIEVTSHLQLVFFFQFVKPFAAIMGLFSVMTLVYWLTISTIVVKSFLISKTWSFPGGVTDPNGNIIPARVIPRCSDMWISKFNWYSKVTISPNNALEFQYEVACSPNTLWLL